MNKSSSSKINDDEIREILSKSTDEEIFKYAFMYLRQKELAKLRKRKQREKEQDENEKNKR